MKSIRSSDFVEDFPADPQFRFDYNYKDAPPAQAREMRCAALPPQILLSTNSDKTRQDMGTIQSPGELRVESQ